MNKKQLKELHKNNKLETLGSYWNLSSDDIKLLYSKLNKRHEGRKTQSSPIDLTNTKDGYKTVTIETPNNDHIIIKTVYDHSKDKNGYETKIEKSLVVYQVK